MEPSLLKQVQQAIDDMDRALAREQELDVTDMPELVATQVKIDAARAWSAAAVRGAKLLKPLLELIEERVPRFPNLAPVELETARNWVRFDGNQKEFAEKIGITEAAARRRLSTIYRKCGAHDKDSLERMMKLRDLI